MADSPEKPVEKAKPAEHQGSTPVAVTSASMVHDWTEPKPKSGGYHWGTGRRKSSIARVRIKRGDGKFVINGKEIDDYFRVDRDRRAITAPLDATDTRKKVDVFVNASGGGTTGQAGAIVLGVARALLAASGEYQPLLRDGGFLTRDARRVERKKYGYRKARRSFQFSKR